MGILATSLQLIVACHDIVNLMSHSIPKGLCRPVADIIMSLGRFQPVEVPSEVHHKRYLFLGWFDIPHIKHPYLTGTIGICFSQLHREEGR